MRKVSTLSVLAAFLLGYQAEAASLYIDPAFSEINRGDAIQLAVRLDVDEEAEECINAVEAVISYTENINPVDLSIGDSIFTVWVEEPTINQEEKTITFAGGLPNGYCGRVAGDPRLTNNLLDIIVRSPGFTIGGGTSDLGNVARVEFTSQTAAYLNDGRGTTADLQTFGAEVTLSSTTGSEIVDTWREEVRNDDTPPEEFSISLEQNDTAFDGQYFIVFGTTDKQTGIDLYEVIEEPTRDFWDFRWGSANAPWVAARSPYVLQDQSLNSVIRVRAIDKAGNEYIANLLPNEDLRTTPVEVILFNTLVGVGVLILLVIGFVFYHIYKKRKPAMTPEVDNEAESET